MLEGGREAAGAPRRRAAPDPIGAVLTKAGADPNAVVLSVEETAAVLRVGRGTAYEACRTGAIPTIRVGRCLRVPRHALEAMMGENGAGSAATLNKTQRPADEPGVAAISAGQGRRREE